MRLVILGAALASAAIGQSTMDLSAGWRFSSEDKPVFAGPDFDDRVWSDVSLPLPVRPSGVAWLRKTISVPPGANALALGFHPPAAVFINGIPQPERALRSGVARSFRIPPGTPGEITIAIRLAKPAGGPNIVIRDYGPFLAGPEVQVESAVKLRNIEAQRDKAPFFIFAGIQLTLALALAVLYWSTRRQYPSLLWIGAYLLYSTSSLFRNMDFLSTPAIPGIAGVLLLQLVLSLSGWRASWLRRGLGIVCGLTLLAPVLGLPREWSSELNNGLHVTSVVLIAVRLCQLPLSFRSGALAVCLGYIVLPLWSAAPWTSGSLVLEAAEYYWPGLALVNVPVTFALLAIWILGFAKDRAEKHRLAAELDAAQAVQRLLFPAPQDASTEAIYLPASEVGGDFWQVLPAANGARLIAIGDVSGKGLRAAMIVSLLTGALRSRQSDHPGEILAALNRVVLSVGDAGFVTALVARLESDGTVCVANAGHLSPYLEGVECPLEGGLPLGLDSGAVYPAVQWQILPGQQLTLVSDGVVEAARPDGELLGFDRTRELSTRSAQAIAEAAKQWGQNDDITVVTVRRVSA